MRAASDRFAAAVKGSHRAATLVESWRGTEQLAESVPLIAGELSADDTQAIPGEVTINVPAGPSREWDPTGDPFHPLAPFGQQLYVSRGIVLPSGVTELLGLGWYLITDADPDPLGAGVKVKAASRERLLEDAGLQRPLQPLAGGTYDSEARRLVGGRIPVDDLGAGLTDRAVPADRVFEGSRLKSLTELATAWPARVVVDSQGLLQLRAPFPDDPAAGVPVLTLSTGARGVVADWQTSSSREDLINVVYARGEEETADGRRVEGYAWDDVTTSPTYVGGPFGEHTMEYSSPLLTTEAQCTKAAQTILAKRLRRTRTAVVTLVPDPRIETGDYVELDTPKVAGVGRVSGVKLPLGGDGGPMVLTVEMGA